MTGSARVRRCRRPRPGTRRSRTSWPRDRSSHPSLAPDGTKVHVTVSLGVAAYPEAAGADNLVAAADGALYEAKRAGKNKVMTAGVSERR